MSNKTGKSVIKEESQKIVNDIFDMLQSNQDIKISIEGHTDNVPFNRGLLLDNWDLSVKRATAVVRILQNEYGLDPKKMAAAGRGEYYPIVDNSTTENKATNRRTRIVILPQLDQFFKLLEPKKPS